MSRKNSAVKSLFQLPFSRLMEAYLSGFMVKRGRRH